MRKKLLFCASLLVVFAAIFGVVSWSTAKRVVRPDAIAVSYASSTYAAGQIPLLFTNTTGKTLAVESVTVETRVGNEWISEKRLERNPQPGMIAPHSYSFLAIDFSSLPAERPWRLKMEVEEEVMGSERLMRSVNAWRTRGIKNPFSKGVIYLGHGTYIFSPEFPSPERPITEAGDGVGTARQRN